MGVTLIVPISGDEDIIPLKTPRPAAPPITALPISAIIKSLITKRVNFFAIFVPMEFTASSEALIPDFV